MNGASSSSPPSGTIHHTLWANHRASSGSVLLEPNLKVPQSGTPRLPGSPEGPHGCSFSCGRSLHRGRLMTHNAYAPPLVATAWSPCSRQLLGAERCCAVYQYAALPLSEAGHSRIARRDLARLRPAGGPLNSITIALNAVLENRAREPIRNRVQIVRLSRGATVSLVSSSAASRGALVSPPPRQRPGRVRCSEWRSSRPALHPASARPPPAWAGRRLRKS